MSLITISFCYFLVYLIGFPNCIVGNDCRPPNFKDWPRSQCTHNPAFIRDEIYDNLKFKSECNYDTPDCCSNHKSVRDEESNHENLNDICWNDGVLIILHWLDMEHVMIISEPNLNTFTMEETCMGKKSFNFL